MKHFIGIDIGTTNCKVLLMNNDGVVTDAESITYTFDQPQIGWSEQAPDLWTNALEQCMQTLMGRQSNPITIAGVGLSGQMHGMTALDENGDVLRPCILWNDQRNQTECDELVALAGGDAALRSMTNNPMLVGFTAGKIRWFQKNEPDLFAKTKIILNPKDYIRYCLTGVMATEVSDASGTGLFDVANRQWSSTLLQKIGIDETILAPCYESTVVSAHVSEQGAERFAIPAGTPVVGGGGDAVIQTLGSGVCQSGMMQTTIGTAGIAAAMGDMALANTEGRIQVSCNVLPDTWHYMGVSLSSGSALQWWKNTLNWQKDDISYDALSQAAETVKIGSDGLIFLPYLMGERCPWPDPTARGAFIGLRANHTTENLCRAVFEGLTFALLDMMSLMKDEDSAQKSSAKGVIYASGGGSQSDFWNQMQADVFGVPVAVTRNSEHGGALGAAIVAAIGTKDWTVDKIEKVFQEEKTWQPDGQKHKAYAPYFALYQDLYQSLQTVNVRLHTLNE